MVHFIKFGTGQTLWTVQLLILSFFVHRMSGESKDEYLTKRKQLISQDQHAWIGAKLKLTTKEEAVNKILMQFKAREFDDAKKQGGVFPPEIIFFHAKQKIEESAVYKMIKNMPKGAALHVHDASAIDMRWAIANFTYLANLYMGKDEKGNLQLHFFKTPPANGSWKLVSEERKKSSSPKEFDDNLYRNMTIVVDDPARAYPSQNKVWQRFQQVFATVNGIFHYAGIFAKYFYQCLEEFYNDNVQYLELRTVLVQLYDLDGTLFEKSKMVDMYHQVAVQFAKDHPDWAGSKLIITGIRGIISSEDLMSDILETEKFRKKYPNFIAGYDLVGQEDLGKPLIDFIDVFTNLSQREPPLDLPYFFHAGETDWEGTDVDENLFDALLLNTTRIGHGYAILKHPAAMKLAIEKDVPLEINPISNQVLGLVKDLRNHPGCVLMTQGFPMVISSDDPGFWGASSLSHDYYEAFMGFGGTWANLATLKQLILDSLKYSAMSDDERQKATIIWQQKWDEFIDKTLQEFTENGR